MDITELKRLKVVQLQEALANRGLPIHGRKSKLLARLEAALSAEDTAAQNQTPRQQQVELTSGEAVANDVQETVQSNMSMDEVAEVAVAEAVNYIQNSNQDESLPPTNPVENTEMMADTAAFSPIVATDHQPAAAAAVAQSNHNMAQLDTAEPSTKTVTTWEMQFNKLKAYKAIHGNCKVPKMYPPDPQLGRWVNTQRYKNNTNTINPLKKEQLNTIDFEWNIRTPNRPWKVWLAELRAYKAEYGHLNVPQRDAKHKGLGAFVSNLRGEYRKYQRGGKGCSNSSLNERKIEILEGMGFRWSVQKGSHSNGGKEEVVVPWEVRVEQLKCYKNQFGHVNVPKDWEEVHGLGEWCETQRQLFNNASLSPEHIRELDELDFNWTIGDMLSELRKYRTQYGNCDVPLDYDACPNLGVWVESQRRKYKSLSKERIIALIELGFDFKADEMLADSATGCDKLDVPSLEKTSCVEGLDSDKITQV